MVEKIGVLEKNTVLFDLDNTLFDHYHSLRSAMTINREKFDLGSFTVAHLIDTYNMSLQTAYDRYLRKKISYEEKDVEKIKLFFQHLNFPIPEKRGIDLFLNSYNEIYLNSRRATPGAVETLVRLNEHGFKIGVVTNGQSKDQKEKMESIGIAHLVDAVFTSEEVGHPKPSPLLFRKALRGLNTTPESTILVGDDIKSDIEGALTNGIDAVLYNPISKENKIEVSSTTVPVIHYMKELLNYLGIAEQANLDKNHITIHGEGIEN